MTNDLTDTNIDRDKEEEVIKAWAETNRVPYFDTRTITKTNALDGVMSVKDMQTYQVVPLHQSTTAITMGYTPTTDKGRLQFVSGKFPDRQVIFNIVSSSGLKDIINHLDLGNLTKATSGSLPEFAAAVSSAAGDEGFRLLCQLAHQLNASDIHIEPKATEAAVRFRIDGILHPIMSLPIEQYKLVLSSVQTISHMQWGTDKPQQGRVTQELVTADGNKIQVNIRLESIPTFHGEELIARILSMDVAFLKLDNMALAQHIRAGIDAVTAHPHGLVLTAGPTGSGKTSMLYAMINQLNSSEVKVVTLEDPVEYDLPGTSQIQVQSDEHESFAEKLKAVLREDPNVIMIGEIRDVDTARTALQASLTGHLVLSTFHANSAAAAVSRLMDMIGQNPLLASALRLVMAQRLIRHLCESCKESYQPDAKEATEIKKILASLPHTIYKPSEKLTLYHTKGCNSCNGFGYKGRFAIIEQLSISPDIEKLITSGGASATTQAIADLATKAGMVTLLQNGLIRALAGDTTIEEVWRSVDA